MLKFEDLLTKLEKKEKSVPNVTCVCVEKDVLKRPKPVGGHTPTSGGAQEFASAPSFGTFSLPNILHDSPTRAQVTNGSLREPGVVALVKEVFPESLSGKVQAHLKGKAETTELARVKYQDICFAPPLNKDPGIANSPTRARVPLSPPPTEEEVIEWIGGVSPGASVQHCPVVPSACVHRGCPAAGYWEGHGSEAWCFYEAVFLGKAAKAQLARERAGNCPRDAKPAAERAAPGGPRTRKMGK
jgi:hypothetical protein